MLIPAIVRALRQPPFQGSDFTATRFAIAEDKAAFGNEIMCFSDCGPPCQREPCPRQSVFVMPNVTAGLALLFEVGS